MPVPASSISTVKATMAQSYLLLTNVGEFLLRVLDITGLRGALSIHEG